VKPPGEDLDRDRFRLGRPDHVQILALENCDGHLERSLDDVEIAHHPALIQGRTLDDDLHAIVVCVEIALRRR
jgi:hypothetical protein